MNRLARAGILTAVILLLVAASWARDRLPGGRLGGAVRIERLRAAAPLETPQQRGLLLVEFFAGT